MTLRELFIRHDAYIIEQWNHTALLTSQLYAIQCIVIGLTGKAPRPKSPLEFHPFLKNKRVGLRVTPENIGCLKELGRALCSARK